MLLMLLMLDSFGTINTDRYVPASAVVPDAAPPPACYRRGARGLRKTTMRSFLLLGQCTNVNVDVNTANTMASNLEVVVGAGEDADPGEAEGAGDRGRDDHGRIQAAIDAVKASGGGIVRLAGRHVFVIKSTLRIPSDVELQGANDGHTYQGAAMTILAVYDVDTAVVLKRRAGLRGK